jgi:DNA-binding MarR family transcriptional regulator
VGIARIATRTQPPDDTSFLLCLEEYVYIHQMPAIPSTTPTSALIDTKACLCLAARRNARTITRFYDEHLRPHGLRSTQFSVLAALSLMGATPLGRLAHVLEVDRTTLTRSAALLERNGWVRFEDGSDARTRPVAVTPAGRSKLEEALPSWAVAQSAMEATLVQAQPTHAISAEVQER